MPSQFLGALSSLAMMVPASVLALPPDGQEGWMAGHHMSYGFHGMWFGPMFIVLAVIAVIMTVMLATRICESRRHHHSKAACAGEKDEKTAMDMLKTRFACGEIDQDEYRARKKVLEE